MRKALASLLSLITVSALTLAVARATTESDVPVPCPLSIAIGDIVGVYSVDKRTLKYIEGSPIPTKAGALRITALNASTLKIEHVGSHIGEGYLYIDQYGTRFLRLNNTTSLKTYQRFGLPMNRAASPYQILEVLALPPGYELRRCKS